MCCIYLRLPRIRTYVRCTLLYGVVLRYIDYNIFSQKKEIIFFFFFSIHSLVVYFSFFLCFSSLFFRLKLRVYFNIKLHNVCINETVVKIVIWVSEYPYSQTNILVFRTLKISIYFYIFCVTNKSRPMGNHIWAAAAVLNKLHTLFFFFFRNVFFLAKKKIFAFVFSSFIFVISVTAFFCLLSDNYVSYIIHLAFTNSLFICRRDEKKGNRT